MLASIRWQRVLALPLTLCLAFGLMIATADQSAAFSHKHHHHKAEKHRKHHIKHAKRIARHQKGDGYRYGASGPGHFDCSGLVKYSFKKAGFAMPRTSQRQYNRVRHIKKKHLRKGDLVFFGSKHDIYHVGIYVGRKHGHRRIVHASEPGKPVKVDRVWTKKYHAGTMRWKN